jgi:hypothetical protein
MASSVPFPRLFTVGEANALLPAVRGLTERIQENIQRLKNKSKIVIRDEQLDPGAADFMDRLQENSEIARLVSEVKDGVEQIQSYGCICKGAEQGLVDFRDCWERSGLFMLAKGETTISYWHRIEEALRAPTLARCRENGSRQKTSYH